MKYFIAFLTVFFTFSCKSRPVIPDIDINGYISIETIGEYSAEKFNINVFFEIKGARKEIKVFLQDDNNVPIGKVILKNRKIIERNITIDEYSILGKLLTYWMYLFFEDSETIKVNGITINYKNRIKIKGIDLPVLITVTESNTITNIRIHYGD